MPIKVEWDFLGHNIVRFDGRYFALSRLAGPVDLVDLRSRGELSGVPSHDLELLNAAIGQMGVGSPRFSLRRAWLRQRRRGMSRGKLAGKCTDAQVVD